jgi:hypothetical protein
MGNHKLEHCQFRINTTPPITSKATVVETQKQHVRIGVTQSFDVHITTIGVETVVVPSIDVIKKGVLIGSTIKLGSGLGGVSAVRNLNQVWHYQ